MNIFGGLGLGQGATVQLVFKTEDGVQPKTATVKAGGAETETLPLYTNKSTVFGEVMSWLHSCHRPLKACHVLSWGDEGWKKDADNVM